MQLLMENWRRFLNESKQLPDEKTDELFSQDITALLNQIASKSLTEGEMLDKVKAFAKEKGLPLAIAAGLLGLPVAGGALGKELADRHNTEVAAEEAAEDAAERQAHIDRFGRDFGTLPAEYSDDLGNKERMELAWESYSDNGIAVAPVAGFVPTVTSDGYISNLQFVVYQDISDNDVLPMPLMTAADYRAKIEAKLADDGEEQGINNLRNMLFGDTGRWASGADGELFRMVDGNPVLPPSWVIAYEVYANAIVDRIEHIKQVAGIGPEYKIAVAERLGLSTGEELDAYLAHELWKVGAGPRASEMQ